MRARRLGLMIGLFSMVAAVANAAPITRLEFHDGAATVAIDTLTYTTTGGVTTTITFSEAGAPAGALDGTTFYDPYGVSFTNSSRFGPDGRLPDDGFGITNFTGSVGGIAFDDDIAEVTLTWAKAGTGISFFANAFDDAGVLIDSFSNINPNELSGVATLAIPEPSGALLFAVGLLTVMRTLRRRSA